MVLTNNGVESRKEQDTKPVFHIWNLSPRFKDNVLAARDSQAAVTASSSGIRSRDRDTTVGTRYTII
ncbi:uncharacterized protein N7477_010260 [Penicillium maclennaniae]|uniref:uncharacterized protein n=1 Tax=Penicillium maclennaniae TaxID=1343394 RepID=UPI0025409EA2|nr:uncharacterized protein N7477_010260 [Penicillium maclennaniae]KAJ5662644.1 hypothetical protein N7477_010260 [Penicillium maclennaniae]